MSWSRRPPRRRARELGTEFASVVELTGDGLGLVVRAGHGLPDGVIGGVLPVRPDELTGFTMAREGPVIVDDYRTETRFGRSSLQRDLGVVSALVVAIRASGSQFGGIGVHSRTPQHFSPDDAHFLQAVANVLGAAVERARHEEVVRDSRGALPRAGRHHARADVDDGRRGRRHVRQRGLAALHGPQRPRGPRRQLRLERPPGRPRRPDDPLARRLRAAHRVPLRVPAQAPRRRASLGARDRHAAVRRRRVRGLRRHRHRHPRAQGDGGRAAPLRGELPRPRRQRPGDDLDDRRPRQRDLRQRGLARLHGHHPRGRAGRQLVARHPSGRGGRRRRRVRARPRAGSAVGARVPPALAHRRVPLGRPSAACRATRRASSSATWARPSTCTNAS